MVKKSGKKKQKALCKLCKEDCLKDSFDSYIKLVQDSKFVCKKCGRTAQSKVNLCKPFEIG